MIGGSGAGDGCFMGGVTLPLADGFRESCSLMPILFLAEAPKRREVLHGGEGGESNLATG
jgi:hypothetical protein